MSPGGERPAGDYAGVEVQCRVCGEVFRIHEWPERCPNEECRVAAHELRPV